MKMSTSRALLSRILTFTIIALVMLLCVRFVGNIVLFIQTFSTEKDQKSLIGQILLLMGRLTLFYLLCNTLLMLSVLLFLPRYKKDFIPRFLLLHFLRLSRSARNTYLFLLSTIGSLWILFFCNEVTVVIAWSFILLFTSYSVQWVGARKSVWLILATLYVFIFGCTIKLVMLQNYHLFQDDGLFSIAACCTLLFTIGWLILYRRIRREINWRKEHFSSLIAINTAFMLHYFQIVLTTVNCYYDPLLERVSYTVTVEEIYPAYQNHYDLCLSYKADRRPHYISMPVSPLIHASAMRGTKLRVQVHTGLLGWTWYHNDIHTRSK